MNAAEKIKNIPAKVKKQMQTVLLLACAVATFAVPAFGGGYSILKDEGITSSAAAIEDVDLLLVAASAFGEARKAMNATDVDAKDKFVENTSAIVTSSKWQNLGLIVGARDALSGSTWSAYQSPITLSATEVATYGDGNLADAYNKYKAFGFAMQNLNNSAQKSNTTAVSVDEGLDAMSAAAIKLGSFGVKFLNDSNPGPVLLALYDSSNLATYSSNKLVQIVIQNDVLKNIVTLFGDTVPGTMFSFFILINAVIAIVGFALSLLLTLLGNRTIGDGIRHFLVRIVIGTVGIYLIANVMSIALGWVTDTILDVGQSQTTSYVENNLNVYDWYLTGFQMPSGVELGIDSSGKFIFTSDAVRAINEYTYNRLVGGASDEAIRARMETYTQNGNLGTASFVTPSITGADGGEAWATDVYYAIMNNYAQNKDLMDGNDDSSSPLYGKNSFSIYLCRYMWMSSLSMNSSGDGWLVRGNGSDSYYGLNPISAFNLVRSDFSGEAITSTSTVYPQLAYVAFDVVISYSASGANNMNSITRFIASFTLILAAMKGLITIFTAGFGGMLAGGIKTAFGSAQGLGQALGAVFALLFGIIGISVIMSMSLSLLDTIYGICKGLLVGTEVVDAFLQPLQDSVKDIPVLGPALVGIAKTITDLILTLILALTFPKLGGIPITVFAQFMSDIPGHMAEKAHMLENMLMSGRSSAGGGGAGSKGHYGQLANQMASQAFANGSRQASQVMKAGVAGVGALAGASLAKAGRALNKKADGIEGKPVNVGISNWDELSPEQQARAAAVAANTPDWENMSEDARQKALADAGVYNDNSADAGTPNTDQTIDNVPETDAEGIGSETEMSPDGTPVEETGDGEMPVGQSLDEDGVPAPADVGMESSMNSPVGGAAAEAGESVGQSLDEDGVPAPADVGMESSMNSPVGGAAAEAGESVVQSQTIEGGETSDISGSQIESSVAKASDATSVAGDTSGASGTISSGDARGGQSGAAPSDSGSGDTSSLNINENNHMDGGSQQFNTNVDQKNKMDAMNVDQSRQLNTDENNDLISQSLDGRSTSNSSNQLPGSAGISSTNGLGKSGMTTAGSQVTAGTTGRAGTSLPTGNSSGRTQSAGQQSGASVTYKSVNSTNQAGGDRNHMDANAQVQNNAQFNTGGDQSQTVNTSPMQPQQVEQTVESVSGNFDQDTDRQAQMAADGGAASQSMNGTATSKWGKEMTLKEQRQTRALHAAGDALQFMGGNRTMSQGVKDALGHAKDAAVSYTVPIELYDPSAHPFLANVRNRRQEQEKKNRKKNIPKDGKK